MAKTSNRIDIRCSNCLPSSRLSRSPSSTCSTAGCATTGRWVNCQKASPRARSDWAEQVVRHGVIMRKISYGTHSTAGSRFVERMLTIHATLRRQHRHILDFMRDSCFAARRDHPEPSILPIEASVSALRRAA